MLTKSPLSARTRACVEHVLCDFFILALRLQKKQRGDVEAESNKEWYGFELCVILLVYMRSLNRNVKTRQGRVEECEGGGTRR